MKLVFALTTEGMGIYQLPGLAAWLEELSAVEAPEGENPFYPRLNFVAPSKDVLLGDAKEFLREDRFELATLVQSFRRLDYEATRQIVKWYTEQYIKFTSCELEMPVLRLTPLKVLEAILPCQGCDVRLRDWKLDSGEHVPDAEQGVYDIY